MKTATITIRCPESARAAAESPGIFWSDECELPELPVEDRNSIGLAFRNQSRAGLIKRLENNRLIRLLLKRNGAETKTGQQEMFEQPKGNQ